MFSTAFSPVSTNFESNGYSLICGYVPDSQQFAKSMGLIFGKVNQLEAIQRPREFPVFAFSVFDRNDSIVEPFLPQRVLQFSFDPH
jgi:hypothetical protein